MQGFGNLSVEFVYLTFLVSQLFVFFLIKLSEKIHLGFLLKKMLEKRTYDVSTKIDCLRVSSGGYLMCFCSWRSKAWELDKMLCILLTEIIPLNHIKSFPIMKRLGNLDFFLLLHKRRRQRLFQLLIWLLADIGTALFLFRELHRDVFWVFSCYFLVFFHAPFRGFFFVAWVESAMGQVLVGSCFLEALEWCQVQAGFVYSAFGQVEWG